MAPDDHDAVARIVAFYENLRPADVERIAEFYAEDAYFRDPFNEVRGPIAIAAIFRRMFADLDACRFRITDVVRDESGAFLVWDFTFRIRRFRPQLQHSIHGASHLHFDAAGRVCRHRDYWDAADELYAKLPVVGSLLRFLKRRLG
jgi:steroid delta-isomerase